MKTLFSCAALLAVITAFPATAADRAVDNGAATGHGGMDMGGMMRVADTAGAEGDGVVHTVDEKEGVVNLTHGPIPSLSWPAMTMDLPVAEGVDLADVQPGDKIRFRIVLGADQVYRITAIEPAP
jgi:Cu(I)/Ag(I) efflux system protein CusF